MIAFRQALPRLSLPGLSHLRAFPLGGLRRGTPGPPPVLVDDLDMTVLAFEKLESHYSSVRPRAGPNKITYINPKKTYLGLSRGATSLVQF